MKKTTLFFVAMLATLLTFSQAPELINYQAVARSNAGVPLANTSVNLIFEIIQTSTAVVVYKETQSDITNNFGLFTSEIGSGTVVTGSFSAISWGLSAHTLRITINGDVMQATQLLSVPYALYAKESLSGPQGLAGINCWDTNNNSFQDLSEDINGDGFWNSLDCVGDSGFAGTAGVNGLSVNWNATQPATPILNDAYYDSVLGQSLIWDGTAWQQMTQDGITPTFFAGPGVSIVGNTISATDTSVTNEIQSLSINGTNDTIFLTNGGFVPLPANNGLWNTNAQGIDHAAGNVGVGTPIPLHKLSVVSTDSVIASFRTNNPNFGAIIISNAIASAPVGTILLSGGDTAIFGMDPLSKQVVMSNTITDGHVIVSADSSVSLSGEVIGVIANSKIINQSDSIFSRSSTGNNIINVNLGSFITDSLYVVKGPDVFTAGYVLTNNGFGQAQWKPSDISSGWNLSGNSFTSVGTDFVGTTDSVDLEFRTNNILRARITQKGQIEIFNTGNSVFIGQDAGANDDLSANGNVFIGESAGKTNSTGFGSVAIGQGALKLNTTGNSNVGTGRQALANNTTGSFNVSNGVYALFYNTTGSGNVAAGYEALTANTNGGYNVASGHRSLYQNTTGGSNIASGLNALYQNLSGSLNVALGSNALYSNTSDQNTAVGAFAGNTLTTGSNNTLLGYNADGIAGLSNATAIGAYANVGASNSLVLGNNANVGIGTSVPSQKLDVAGTAEIDSLRINNSYAFPTAAGVPNQVLTADASGNATWQTPVAGATSPWTIGTGIIHNTADNVGIGTSNPIFKLDVDPFATYAGPIARVRNLNASNVNDALQVVTNGSGAGLSLTQVGTGHGQSISLSNAANTNYALQITTDGAGNGINITHSGSTAGTRNGIASVANGVGATNNNGGNFSASGATTSNFAVNANATASGTAQAMGTYSTVGGSTTNNTYGVYGQNSSSTTGLAYGGFFESFNNTGTPYGIRSRVISTANTQYGIYSEMNSTAAGATKYGIYTSVIGGATNWAAYFASGNVYIADTLIIPTNAGSGKILTSDAAGVASWKSTQIGFEARGSTSQNVDNTPTYVQFDALSFDDGVNFDASAANYSFNAPVSGVYAFNANVLFDYSSAGPNDITVVEILVNGAPQYSSKATIEPGERATNNVMAHVRLSAGDIIQVWIYIQGGSSGVMTGGADEVWFSGHLVYAY
jgi:hypothetical protein